MDDAPEPHRLEVEHFAGVSRARLAGALDEGLAREPFAVLKGRGAAVVFDLDDVASLTDAGARRWLEIIRELPSERYYFVRCRPPVVRQLSEVAGFGGRGHVVSFYCPYRCTSCSARFDGLVDLRRERASVARQAAPAAACPACGAAARFDGDEAAYLERAATWNVPRLSAEVEAVIDGRAPAPALRIDKTVRGDLTVLWLSGTLDRTERVRRVVDGLEDSVLVMAGGITAASPAAVEALLSLLEASRAEILVARVPRAVLMPLAARSATARRLLVVSVVDEVKCAACGVTSTIDVLAWRDGAAGAALRCPACREARLQPPPPDVQAALSLITVAVAPPSARAFLESDAPPPHPAVAGGS